jgi:hypothetical protein
VATIRVPRSQRARREILKHAPKLVSFSSSALSLPDALFPRLFLSRAPPPVEPPV